MKVTTYQANFYHNGHSMQRDRMLIEMYGEEWLKEQKAKGLYGGDWPEEIVGTPKEGKSYYIKEDGSEGMVGEVVYLKSLEDLCQQQ